MQDIYGHKVLTEHSWAWNTQRGRVLTDVEHSQVWSTHGHKGGVLGVCTKAWPIPAPCIHKATQARSFCSSMEPGLPMSFSHAIPKA